VQTTIELAETKESELQTQGSAIVAESKTYAMIRDDEHRDAAMTFGVRVKRMRELVADLFDDPVAQAHKLHKSLCSRRKTLDDPLDEAERAVKRGIGGYEQRKRDEIEAIRRKEMEEARRQAELAEIERQKAIDDARKSAEDARLKQAEELEAQGKHDLANRVMEAPVMVQAPPPVQVHEPVAVTPKYEPPVGASVRKTWKYRIVDPNMIPREYLVPNETLIGGIARTMKEKASIPGIEFYSEASASLR